MRFLLLLMAAISTANAHANERAKVRVTGDRVSLRTAPDLESYLLDRAMRGDEMACCGRTNGWVAVKAPDSLDFWVLGEYVQNGVVQPKKLNVRAGPSQNYPNVTVVERGDSLSVRDEFNGWLKIAPPSGSQVWVSEDFVEIIEPPRPKPEPVVEPEPMPEPVVVEAAEPKGEELPPLMLVLDKKRRQGEYDEIAGVLRRANPGLYKLVLIEDGIEEPICLVRGNESQMERYLNRAMLAKGPVYWAKDVDLPIIQPENLHLDPIVSE